MSQSVAQVPEHSHYRKSLICMAGVKDHAGEVDVQPVADFDLNRTIFQTLEGGLPRAIMQTRVAKHVVWHANDADRIDRAYADVSAKKLPPIDEKLLQFLVDECDFNVEHADGSFLDHLYYCYEYTYHHYPQYSPLAMLLHSILGTGTNTFAMEAEKIPQLKALMDDFTWKHVEAFPSVLRLLYTNKILDELKKNQERLSSLKEVHLYRVIDNEPIVLSAEDFWVQLNYQLIHLTDFIPVSNWTAHKSDTSFILFRKLYPFLEASGKLEAKISYKPPGIFKPVIGEKLTALGWFLTILPSSVAAFLSAKSVEKFSARIGHSLDYKLVF